MLLPHLLLYFSVYLSNAFLNSKNQNFKTTYFPRKTREWSFSLTHKSNLFLSKYLIFVNCTILVNIVGFSVLGNKAHAKYSQTEILIMMAIFVVEKAISAI